MFKRVNKHLKRKREEEELGLDDEEREAFGVQDTDSEESESESESGSGSDESNAEASSSSNKNNVLGPAGPLSDESSNDEDDEDQPLESSNSDLGRAQALALTVRDVYDDPFYVAEPGVSPTKRCVLCSSKVLKTQKLMEVHQNSGGHIRRWKRYKTYVDTTDPKEQLDNPHEIIAHLDEVTRRMMADIEQAKVARKANQLAKRMTPELAARLRKSAARKAKREARKPLKAERRKLRKEARASKRAKEAGNVESGSKQSKGNSSALHGSAGGHSFIKGHQKQKPAKITNAMKNSSSKQNRYKQMIERAAQAKKEAEKKKATAASVKGKGKDRYFANSVDEPGSSRIGKGGGERKKSDGPVLQVFE